MSSSPGRITLQPGIYVITRQIKLSKYPSAGNASVYAHGVMSNFASSSYAARASIAAHIATTVGGLRPSALVAPDRRRDD